MRVARPLGASEGRKAAKLQQGDRDDRAAARLPRALDCACATTKVQGLLRRPVVCLDTNQYRFDDQGHFEALDGFDFEAGQSSTLSLSVQRVNVNQVYNQWPGHQKAIAQWIKDHESTVR